MVELVRSNDLVFLSWAQAMLAAEGIEAVLLDGHTSAIEGSIARRVAVLRMAGEPLCCVSHQTSANCEAWLPTSERAWPDQMVQKVRSRASVPAAFSMDKPFMIIQV